jgi:hypothetical protein
MNRLLFHRIESGLHIYNRMSEQYIDKGDN